MAQHDILEYWKIKFNRMQVGEKMAEKYIGRGESVTMEDGQIQNIERAELAHSRSRIPRRRHQHPRCDQVQM